jgi:hypothetical protein
MFNAKANKAVSELFTAIGDTNSRNVLQQHLIEDISYLSCMRSGNQRWDNCYNNVVETTEKLKEKEIK